MMANTRHPFFAPAPAIPLRILDLPSAPPSVPVSDKTDEKSRHVDEPSQVGRQIPEDDQSHDTGHARVSSPTPALIRPEEDIIQRRVRPRVS